MIHTKRYLAAAGANYYASRYLGDIVGAFDTVGEAMQAAKDADDNDWACVYDLLTGQVVAVELHVFNFDDGHSWQVGTTE